MSLPCGVGGARLRLRLTVLTGVCVAVAAVIV